MAKALKHKGASTVVWVLMAMLVLGLGGFGVQSFSANVRSIGTVGDRDIDLNDYARTLDQELKALAAQVGQPVPFDQAEALGVNASVLSRVVAAAALDNETARMGLSVGDDAIRRQVLSMPAFQGIDGAFDRDAYGLALRQSGLNEADFEEKLRDEAARTLLQGAIVGGVAPPKGYSSAIHGWLSEERRFSYVALGPSDLPDGLPDPSDADLKAYYDAHPEAFTSPEVRDITFAWLTPEMVLGKVAVDDTALREAYEARREEFVQPERRMVERLVFSSEADAATAKARLDAGDASFEQLAAERGLTLDDIDLGEVTAADLGAAGEAVFAMTEPGVAGPLPSDLGPALYSMNAILLAQETPFDEARETLLEEVQIDRARRYILDQATALEDTLAGGATLEQLADETDMEIGQIDFFDGSSDPIAGYAGFREAALAVTEQDFPELIELDDGSVVALRLNAIRPPAPEPFDGVKDRAIEGWRIDATRAQLTALADGLKAKVDSGTPVTALGYVTGRVERMDRRGFVEGAPAGLLETVFNMAPGEARIISEAEKVWLVRLDDGTPARPDGGEDGAALRAGLDAQVAQGISNDLFDYFTKTLEAEAGIRLNQSAIDAVHAQFR